MRVFRSFDSFIHRYLIKLNLKVKRKILCKNILRLFIQGYLENFQIGREFRKQI